LFVKFEDLCRQPDIEMRRIYTYLDLPYYQHDFNNVEQITQEDDAIYGIYGDHTIKPKLEPQKNDYKDVLGVNASNWIRQNFSWFYDEFKYI
jgi:sulfotransferase